MGKLYFLAKYLATNRGGGLIRHRQMTLFRQYGIDVTSVTPNWDSSKLLVQDGNIRIPFKGYHRFQRIKEYLGLAEDYLDYWGREAYQYLLPRLKSTDVLFATASGELACLKLASQLKDATRARYVANLHDPLSFSKVNGKKFGSRPHANRERSEQRYLANVDLVFTCSNTYCDALKNKYPQIAGHIINSYFGYVHKEELRPKLPCNKLRIAYGGSFLSTQRPEILAQATAGLMDIEVYYIGNHVSYKPLKPFRDRCIFVDAMPQRDFNRYMMDHIDVGFVSLSKDYFGACVPSKIFEYLNLGLPILGALPNGDAKDIINEGPYGIAKYFQDHEGIREAARRLRDEHLYKEIRRKVIADRVSWSMERRIEKIITSLKQMGLSIF